jgi:hypothetical protein
MKLGRAMDTSTSSERVGFRKRIAGLLKGTLRLAAALTLAGIALGGLALGWQFVDASIKQAKAAPYETVRSWGDVAGPGGLRISARSRLVHGRMNSQVSFVGSPAYLERPENKARSFFLIFSDREAFTIYRRELPFRERQLGQDGAGKPASFIFEFEDELEPEQYGRIHTVRVAWNLETSEPETTSPNAAEASRREGSGAGELSQYRFTSKVDGQEVIITARTLDEARQRMRQRDDEIRSMEGRTATNPETGTRLVYRSGRWVPADPDQDHCAPGLSREERLRRLAALGQVRETGGGVYESGAFKLELGPMGTVNLCK